MLVVIILVVVVVVVNSLEVVSRSIVVVRMLVVVLVKLKLNSLVDWLVGLFVFAFVFVDDFWLDKATASGTTMHMIITIIIMTIKAIRILFELSLSLKFLASFFILFSFSVLIILAKIAISVILYF